MNVHINQKSIKIISALGFICSVAICISGWRTGIFTSQEKLQAFIGRFGLAGSLVFILFQAVQVVIPILPGGVGCLGGVLLFGTWKGFLYNYVGICIGSFSAFLVAKYYGRTVLNCFFSEKLIQKYDKWTSQDEHFTKLFAIAILLPVAPDDFLCYLAGTTKMSLCSFTAIILLCKPFAIAIYSLGLTAVFAHVTSLIGG